MHHVPGASRERRGCFVECFQKHCRASPRGGESNQWETHGFWIPVIPDARLPNPLAVPGKEGRRRSTSGHPSVRVRPLSYGHSIGSKWRSLHQTVLREWRTPRPTNPGTTAPAYSTRHSHFKTPTLTQRPQSQSPRQPHHGRLKLPGSTASRRRNASASSPRRPPLHPASLTSPSTLKGVSPCMIVSPYLST